MEAKKQGNAMFFGEQNPSIQRRDNHPIWPGIERNKTINITVPEMVYRGLSCPARDKRRVPTWIKQLGEALVWGIFTKIQNVSFVKEDRTFVGEIKNPPDQKIDDISVQLIEDKIIIEVSLT